jgi:hypothetical protein
MGIRLILINTALTSLSVFIVSFFEIPKGVRKRFDFIDRVFFSSKVMAIRISIAN